MFNRTCQTSLMDQHRRVEASQKNIDRKFILRKNIVNSYLEKTDSSKFILS